MSLKTIIILLLNVGALYLMFIVAREPGGSIMYMSIICTVVALVSLNADLYSTMSSSERYLFAGNGSMVGGFFLAMAVGSAYIASNHIHAPAVIAKSIDVYPNMTDIISIPPLKHDCLWSFIVKTDDPPEKVTAYYQDSKHRRGWIPVDKNSIFELKKPGYRLFLMITRGQYGKGASIQYQLEDRKNHSYAEDFPKQPADTATPH